MESFSPRPLLSAHRSHVVTWASIEDTSTCTATDIIAPGGAFRSTTTGELSVVSFNMLAPFYQSLSVQDPSERLAFAENDRRTRFPLAMQMVKQMNADILLLQEVEGGSLYEPNLEKLLKTRVSDELPGYDSYTWMPLLPNKPDHPVGLCVAWRSEKHQLVAQEGYKRGMACQFRETQQQGGGTFAVANVHLPARPNQILGRLVYMSKSLQKLADMDVSTRTSPLDGLLMVGGDWNCDPTSPTARLLTHGRIPSGNIRDRNYKANVSKTIAIRMQHGYRFQDVYGDNDSRIRQDHAPVTVALKGRGPGVMDHLFYTQASPPSKNRVTPEVSPKTVKLVNGGKGRVAMSKRKVRREKATRMRRTSRAMGSAGGSFRPNVRLESILATINANSRSTEMEIILQGLPNVPAGYPSDHMPIGALFVPVPTFGMDKDTEVDNKFVDEAHDKSTVDSQTDYIAVSVGSGASSVRRKREAGDRSMSIRRRHNLVLRTVAEWLEEVSTSPTEIIRDQPLYKNPWTKDVTGLTKKSRAPDLVCKLGDTLAIVEITVVSSQKVDAVAHQKQTKYSDLSKTLMSDPRFQLLQLSVAEPLVVVMDDQGGIPESTRSALKTLAKLSSLYDEGTEGPSTNATNILFQRLRALF